MIESPGNPGLREFFWLLYGKELIKYDRSGEI
nr:MAG TPA: hypothetical protein [Caudoviricetes sp.]